MNQQVLESFTLICPACRNALRIGSCIKEDSGYFIEGFLDCTACHSRYPVIAGVPVILKDMAAWWSSIGSDISANLSCDILEYFAECDTLLSTYLQSHYDGSAAYWNSLRECLDTPLNFSLDMGCATGAYTFELASHSKLAVGMDLNFRLVSAAARIQREQSIRFLRKRSCRHAEVTEYDFDLPTNVLFMVADVLEPPFLAGIFDFVSGLNLLDNVRFPLIMIGQMDALLKSGGSILLTSPFAWNSELSESVEWLENEEVLKSVIVGESFPQMELDYRIIREIEHLEWVLPQDDRLKSVYSVYLLLAQKG